ncbi:MAG: histidine phosphatase family protein [Bacteroidota bacterium]
MKTLILVRHAKSSWDDASLSDFNRPLNERGERDAPRMAKRLKEKDLPVDTILTSPSVRTLTTCNVFVDVLGLPKAQVKTVKELYHAGDEMILKVIKGINDNCRVAMIFGHNPGLTDFVNNLCEEEIDNIPTCGVVRCELKVDRWNDVKWGSAEITFFDYPKKHG